MLWSELASLLFDQGMVRVYLEPMHRYFRVDSSHVFVRPSEAIVVLLEELDECKVEFRAKVCSNLNFVVWVVGVDVDIIEFIYARLIRFWELSRGRL